MPNKHSFEYVKQYFTEHNCELLEAEYVNCKSKMKYKCSCGNASQTTWSDFKESKKCMACGANQFGENNHKWNPNREQVIYNYNFKRKCKELIRHILRYPDRIEKDKKSKSLGYSYQDLITHLESHLNWNKDEKLSCDHIFPIKAFLDYGIKDMKIVNALDNLQPLSQKENNSKNSKYNKEDFENWLTYKGVSFTSQIKNKQ